MKIFSVLFVFLCVSSLLLDTGESSPVKIPIKAIKNVAKAVGHRISALHIGSKAHDIYRKFKHKKRKN